MNAITMQTALGQTIQRWNKTGLSHRDPERFRKMNMVYDRLRALPKQQRQDALHARKLEEKNVSHARKQAEKEAKRARHDAVKSGAMTRKEARQDKKYAHLLAMEQAQHPLNSLLPYTGDPYGYSGYDAYAGGGFDYNAPYADAGYLPAYGNTGMNYSALMIMDYRQDSYRN
jgi:hypothetical protein